MKKAAHNMFSVLNMITVYVIGLFIIVRRSWAAKQGV